MPHMVSKWIFHRPWNYMKTASKLFEIIIWAQMSTQQIILWKNNYMYLNSPFFELDHYDSGFQQMGLQMKIEFLNCKLLKNIYKKWTKS